MKTYRKLFLFLYTLLYIRDMYLVRDILYLAIIVSRHKVKFKKYAESNPSLKMKISLKKYC